MILLQTINHYVNASLYLLSSYQCLCVRARTRARLKLLSRMRKDSIYKLCMYLYKIRK